MTDIDDINTRNHLTTANTDTEIFKDTGKILWCLFNQLMYDVLKDVVPKFKNSL